MSNRAWMPLHIDDYITDTDHLTATEHGAYLLLIMKYWRDGGLPADEGMIRRYAKLTAEQWSESRDVIAAFFDENWRHGRIDAELAKADGIIEKRRAAAGARHGKSKDSAHAEHMQSTCTDTGVPPLTDNLDSSLRSESGEKERERADFDIWFSGWPTQATDDDDAAFRAWLALSDEERGAARAQSAAYVGQAGAGGRTVIPSAASYLKKRLWTRIRDRPPDKPAKGANGSLAAFGSAKPLSREAYIASEIRRSERSFKS